MNIREKRLEELKKKTDPVDASNMIEFILRARQLPKHNRQNIVKSMIKAFNEAGNLALLRAFEEGILTEEEWININKKYGINIEEMGTILGAYFAKQKIKDECLIVTEEGTNIYKNKEFVYDRFKVLAITPKEALEKIEIENVNDILTSKLQ